MVDTARSRIPRRQQMSTMPKRSRRVAPPALSPPNSWSNQAACPRPRRDQAFVMRALAPASVLLALAICAPAAPAAAQQPPPEIGPLTTTLDLRALQDLPSTGNLFSLLETTQPEIVSDRFSGSVNLAEPARLGVFLTSWTQTTFTVDGVDITSAERGGPLVVPPVLAWQSVGVTSGAFPIDVSGPGLLIALGRRQRTACRPDRGASRSGSGLRLRGRPYRRWPRWNPGLSVNDSRLAVRQGQCPDVETDGRFDFFPSGRHADEHR
jgi:hypothetical protein